MTVFFDVSFDPMTISFDGQIQNRLKQLKLAGILDTLPVRLKQAEQSNSGYMDFLITLLEDEYERRQAGRKSSEEA